MQLSAVVKHQTTADHVAASESDLMRKALYRRETLLGPTIDVDPVNGDEIVTISPSDKCLFSTVYYAAQKCIANDAVNSMLNLQRFNAVDCKYIDLHSSTIISVQESLVAVLDKQLAERICQSNFYGILIDESTDIAIHKSMVMYLRYVYNGKVLTEFVGNIRVSDGTADSLVRAIDAKFAELEIDFSTVVGFASDGASVMTGRKTGVGARLAVKCPGLIQVHCVAHRLNLACLDALKQNSYLQHFRAKVNSLFSYFSKSSARCDRLKLFQEAIGEQQLRLKHAIEIRWLAMFDAVAAIHKSYGALVATLTEDAHKAPGQSANAKTILAVITDYNFPALIALLSDALKVITDLSKKFQEENIDLSSVAPNVHIAIGKLQGMQQHPGPCLREFIDNVQINENQCTYRGATLTWSIEQAEAFECLKTEYIVGVVAAIRDRFETESSSMLNCFLPIEPAITCSDEQTAYCLEQIAEKYNFAVDVAILQTELVAVDALKIGCYKGYSMRNFAEVMLSRHASELPQTCKLCEIALCIPVSTAVCERGFSRQNLLKNKMRNCLNESNLDNLMKICNGPEYKCFHFNAAVRHWYAQKKRRQAKLFTMSKSCTGK